MSDNLMEKVSSLGERLRTSGSEVGRKLSSGMSSMSFKMRELLHQGLQSPADKAVEEATSESMDGPDWTANLEICDAINRTGAAAEFIRGVKKRIMVKNPAVQCLALVLLETCVKNCDTAFAEVAAERVLDEMIRLVDDPRTAHGARDKALALIEAWGESADELRYLPVFEETCKSLKSRGIRFPGRNNEGSAPIFAPPHSVSETESTNSYDHNDVPLRSFTAEQMKESFDVARNSVELLSTVLSSSPREEVLKDELTNTLVQQCRESRCAVQKIIETAVDNEAVLFEALNMNDELQKVLSKYEELKKHRIVLPEPQLATTMAAAGTEEYSPDSRKETLARKPAGPEARPGAENDILTDLDEKLFGSKEASGSSESPSPNKKQQQPDDLITF